MRRAPAMIANTNAIADASRSMQHRACTEGARHAAGFATLLVLVLLYSAAPASAAMHAVQMPSALLVRSTDSRGAPTPSHGRLPAAHTAWLHATHVRIRVRHSRLAPHMLFTPSLVRPQMQWSRSTPTRVLMVRHASRIVRMQRSRGPPIHQHMRTNGVTCARARERYQHA
jgi:hypothetical protein